MDNERSSERPVGDRSLPDGDSKAVILIVDDEPDTLVIFRLYLSARGFEILTAGSAAEALRCIEQRLPDLIITDYSMPATTGLELCRVLRARGDTRRIPILLHTAVELPAEIRQVFDRAFLKPVEFDDLIACVRALVPKAHEDDLHRGRAERREN